MWDPFFSENVELVEVEQVVTDFLLTALEFPKHPDMGMLQCRKAIECIIHNIHYQEYGEYPQIDNKGNFPALIKIWNGIKKNLDKQTSEVIFSVNSQTRGGLHWDMKTHNEPLKDRHVKAVITQICNVFEDTFHRRIRLEGLTISDSAFENNVKTSLNEELTSQGIPDQIGPTTDELNEDDLAFISNLANAVISKGLQLDNFELARLGNAAFLQGNFDDAEDFFEQALRNFRNENDRLGEAHALNSLGWLESSRENIEQSRKLYIESLAIYKDIEDLKGIIAVSNNLAVLLGKEGYLEEAEDFFRNCLSLYKEIEDRNGEASVLSNLSNIASDKGNLDEAERLAKESTKIFNEFGNEIGVAENLVRLGIISCQKENFIEGERLFRESLKLCVDLDYPEGEAIALHNLGNVEIRRGEVHKAAEFYAQAVIIQRKMGIPISEQWASKKGILDILKKYDL